MADEELPLPREIPWRLAATTQSLHEGFPDDTTIALFVYDPSDETLEHDYPFERLVYLKLTVSISPVHVDDDRSPEWARGHLVGDLPVLHVILDVGVMPQPFVTGVIRPYFHAAAPVHRSMLETGVVGRELYEGDANAIAVGRSASQLYETVGSHVTTRSKGSSGGLPGIFSVDRSQVDTDVDSSRSSQQFQETVSREASTERRELLSHTTKVENVLTLLTAKHVGSPFLRFTLSPRPLTNLSVDPGDQNLWYRQLVQRRSSGIEGMQEFLAVVAVPRGQTFCVQALLRRISVLDDPPAPPELPRSTAMSNDEETRIVDYLYRTYPLGTPLDELDVDVSDQFSDPDAVPSVFMWYVALDTVFGLASYPTPFRTPIEGIQVEGFAYKPATEVRREMLLDEYLTDLARSPLERGVVTTRSTRLRACFRTADARTNVAMSEAGTTAVGQVAFRSELDHRAPRTPHRPVADLDMVAAVTRWNTLEHQLHDWVARLPEAEQQALSLDSPGVLAILLHRWSKWRHDDPRNLSLDDVAAGLRLSASHVASLKAAGATDLRSMARALLNAGTSARLKRDMEEYLGRLDERERCRLDLPPVKPGVAEQDAELVLACLREALRPPDGAP